MDLEININFNSNGKVNAVNNNNIMFSSNKRKYSPITKMVN